MPELPEVETVRLSLIDLVKGRTIKSADVIYGRIIQDISIDEFKKRLENERINDILRYGKYLFFKLDHYTLISHLRMEGKYFYKEEEIELTKHDHIVFHLDNNYKLVYNDTRKFGVMYLINETDYDKVCKCPPINKLGIEANSLNLTKEYLFDKFSKKTGPIKSELLDQEIICGLGNIYADEVLFLSKLHPLKKANTLTINDCELIANASRDVMAKAISLGGTTIKSFMSSHEISGLFQNELNVHTKDKCKICDSDIIKIRVGGRGTYYCPICQK